MLKNIFKDPRPNFACNQQYGNPSNHAVFYSSMLVWFLCEQFYLNKKYRFKYNSIKLFFVLLTPFVLYSRIYLNYHKFEQVIFIKYT
jgi:membrane-associated phospholipid phosphatase